MTINKTLSLVLYSCKAWSLTLREEHRLRLFENAVLRKIFGSKSEEETGDGGRLHNEELHDLYPLPNIIRVINQKERVMLGIWRGKRCIQACGGEP
jgi:hypothetical protein